MKKPSNPSRTTLLEARVKELEAWKVKIIEALAAVEMALQIKPITDEPAAGDQRGVKYGE